MLEPVRFGAILGSMMSAWSRIPFVKALMSRVPSQGGANATAEAPKSKLVRIASTLFGSNVALAAIQFISVPTFLMSWGADLYGVWLVIGSIPAYISTLDSSLTTAAHNRMESAAEKGSLDNAYEILKSSTTLVVFVAITAFVITSLVGVLSTMTFDLGSLDMRSVSIAIMALAADAALSLVISHISGFFRIVDRYDATIAWQSWNRLMPLVALFLVVLTKPSLIVAAITLLLARALVGAAVMTSLSRHLSASRLADARLIPGELLTNLRDAGAFIAFPLGNALLLQAPILIIGAFQGPASVAAFSTARTFSRLIPQFAPIGARALWSDITRAHARLDRNALKELLRKTLILTAGPTLLCAVAMAALGSAFIRLWTGGTLDVPVVLLLALVAHASMISLYTGIEITLLASNEYGRYSVSFISLALVQVLAFVPASREFGVVAIPVIGLIGSTAIALYAYGCARRVAGHPLRWVVKGSSVP